MSVFKHQPGLRDPILEDLATSVLPLLHPVGAKSVTRLFLAQGHNGKSIPIQVGSAERSSGLKGPPPSGAVSCFCSKVLRPPVTPALPHLQMCVALVMQLVQGAADMPQVDVGAKAAYERCGHPHIWASRFWKNIVDR